MDTKLDNVMRDYFWLILNLIFLFSILVFVWIDANRAKEEFVTRINEIVVAEVNLRCSRVLKGEE